MFLQRFFFSLFFFCSLSVPVMAAQATFSWLPNSETNLSGYKVYYGISSRNYTNVIDVGLPDPVSGRIQATVDNLTEGETYYFAATAYDGNGLESDYSDEINHTIANIAIDPQPSGQADFSWLPNTEPNLVGYKIYYGTASRTYTTTLDIGLPDPINGRIHGTITNLSEGKTYYFAATAYDGQGLESDYSDEIVYTVSASGSTSPPAAANSSISGNEDTPITGALVVDNPSGLPLQYAVTTSPAHGTLTIEDATGQFTYHPLPDFNGQDTFSFTATNDNGVSNTAIVTITVNPVNDLPTAQTTTFTTEEDSTVSGQLSASDIDGNTLSYVLVDQPGSGTVTVSTDGTFAYTPNENANGTDTFTFKANDGTSDSNTATVTITVNPVNDSPTTQSASFATDEDTALSGQLNASDIDGDTLSYTLVGQPGGGSVTINTNGTFTYTPNENANGTDTFTFKANDGTSDSNTATVTITVSPVNDPPTAQATTFTTEEDSTVSGQLNGSDIDGDTLSYILVDQPGSGTVTVGTTGTFTYTPDENTNGTDTFTFKAGDGAADSNTATVTITVNPVNDPPTAQAASFTTDEDIVLSGQLNASDIDGDTLSYTLVGQPGSGSVTINTNGTFTYTPNENTNGTNTFTFKVNDGTSDSNTAIVTITVNPVNDLPTAQTTTFTTEEDSTVSGQLNASDLDGDTLSYALVDQPGSGTATLNTDGTFTYTPNENTNGTDTFTFKVNDGNADSNTATVTITVNAVNDPPTVQAASFTTDENSVLSGQLSASDLDGDTLSYALVDQPGSGTATVNTDGMFTYTPNENTNGTDTFTFKVGDGTADSNTATVTITVNAVNDAPTADNQSISIDAGSTISGLLTATDPDGDNLTFALASAATQGDVSINADGTFTYIARQDATGTDTFTFRANDGGSDSNIATVAITITASTTDFRFELHELQVDSAWQSLSYDSPFTNPVVIARASSFADSETGVVRVKNVTETGLELRFQEWDSLDDQHPAETITVMVAEAGTFTLDDGTMIEAGCFATSGASTFSTFSFLEPMSTPPVVMAAVDTVNETDAVTTRIRNITTEGFDFMMREQEVNATTHAGETACYLAWEPSMGRFADMQYEVAVTGDQITANAYSISYSSRFIELPMVLAAMQTTDGGDTAILRINTSTIEGMDVLVSEEQSRDAETAHTTERGGYIAIAAYDPAGDPDGDTLSTSDEENIYNTHPGVADTDHDGIDDGAEITYWQNQGSSWSDDIDQDGLINLLDQDSDNDGMADGSEIAAGFDPGDPASVPGFPIMDGGEVDVDSSWLHVEFTTTFTNPVIIARLVSKNGNDPCVVRIDNITGTGFDLRLQEYEYLDGTHTVEQVSYLVMEAGHYTLADGTQVEAGTFSTNVTSTYDSRSFNQVFSQAPVVITSVASSNEADTVTARIRKVDTNGFECKLQEQEINTKSHLVESLAYIAWEPSNGSENGLRYEVGRSADTVTHATTTLNYTTGFNTKPLLYTDMQTTDGGDTSILRTLSNEAAGLQVTVEEEQSRDSEVSHTTEVAGFIAILSE